MKKISLALSLALSSFGFSIAQSGSNGPMMVEPEAPTRYSQASAFQQELEAEIVDRLQNQEQISFVRELESYLLSGADEAWTDTATPDQEYLWSQAEKLRNKLVLMLDEQQLSAALREEESLSELNTLETNAVNGRIAVLEEQLGSILSQLVEEPDGSILMAFTSDDEYQAADWLIQAEKGLIR